MEPFDFDKLIQQKLLEETDLHQHEMEKSKPFVWSALQNKLEKKKAPTWFHLAAAILILLFVFSFVLINLQNNHQKEINVLVDKMDHLERKYESQVSSMKAKDSKVETLENKLAVVQAQLIGFQEKSSILQKETIVYRKDTVLIKQIEYRTIVKENPDSALVMMKPTNDEKLLTESVTPSQSNKSDVIFPGNSEKAEEDQTETLKLKFGSFAFRKN